MKNQLLNCITIILLSFYLSSCYKEDKPNSGSGSSNTGSSSSTNSQNSPNAPVNTQPTGCGTYNPMFKGSYYTVSKNGSNTDTFYSKYLGKDTTINGLSYTISVNMYPISSNNSTGYARRDGSKTIIYSYLSPKPFEMIMLDETKKVNDEWNAGQFIISVGSGVEVTNKYTCKILNQHPTYTLSNGLKFNDVIEVSLKNTATTTQDGIVVGTATTDGGIQFYAKCVGVIKTFTPKNPTVGFFDDLTQEVKNYKM